MTGVLTSLAVHFTLLSLLAIGGANVIVPEMHRQMVEVSGWMTARQFADLYALAQVAPGPNIIVVTLLGFQVAGLPGALVATAAMCTPSGIVTYFAGGFWERFHDAPWRIVVQSAMVPLSIGLVGATALILARTADTSIVAVIITAATAAVAYWTRIHPLWMFALAGALGYIGLV
jgi:chromate transporter